MNLSETGEAEVDCMNPSEGERIRVTVGLVVWNETE